MKNPKLINEEQKTEILCLLMKKKKINLKLSASKLSFDVKTEIKTSDSLNANKTKCIKNIISSHLYRCLIFSPIVTESIFKRHLTLTYRGLIYAKKCLKEPSKAFIKSKLVNLVDSKRFFLIII